MLVVVELQPEVALEKQVEVARLEVSTVPRTSRPPNPFRL